MSDTDFISREDYNKEKAKLMDELLNAKEYQERMQRLYDKERSELLERLENEHSNNQAIVDLQKRIRDMQNEIRSKNRELKTEKQRNEFLRRAAKQLLDAMTAGEENRREEDA